MSKTRQQQLDALIDEFHTAMLVTTARNGEPRARPMALAGRRRGSELYFATRAEDEKLSEILEEPRVALTMQSKKRFVSITGRAHVELDPTLAENLWSPTMRLWFPDGPADPGLVFIRVDVKRAEFWDRSGLRALEFYWRAGRAILAGDRTPDSTLSGHAKIDM